MHVKLLFFGLDYSHFFLQIHYQGVLLAKSSLVLVDQTQ